MKWAIQVFLALSVLLVPARTYPQKPELIAQVGHTQAPHWLKFGLQSRILISAGDDHLITVWDIEQHRLVLTAPFVSGGRAELEDPGGAFAFSVDGTFMAVHTALDTIKVWNLATGAITHTIKVPVLSSENRYEEISISVDGRFLSRIFAGDKGDGKRNDYLLHVWDLSDGREHESVLGTLPSATAEFSPDGRLLILTSSVGDNLSKGVVWNLAAGAKLYEITDRSLRISGRPKYFSSDGQVLFVQSDGMLQVLDAHTGLNLAPPIAVAKSAERVEMVDASEDHKLIAAVVRTYRGKENDEHHLKIWRIPEGTEPSAIKIYSGGFDAESLAFSPDSQFITCRVGALEDTHLKAWNISTGAERFATKVDDYSNVSLSQNGRLLAVGNRTTGIDLLSSVDGSKLRTLSAHTPNVGLAEFSSDGNTLITTSTGSDSAMNVGVWNLQTGWLSRSIPGELIAVSRNGRRVVTRETIKSQSAEKEIPSKNEAARYQNTIWDVETGERISSFEGEVESANWGQDVSVVKMPDGIRSIELEAGRVIATPGVSGFTSPNRRYLAHDVPEKSTTEIYSVATGKLLSSWRWTTTADNPYLSVSWSGFSPDSRYYAASINSSSDSNVIEIHDVLTGKLWRSLPGNAYQTADYHYNLVFSADSGSLIVADEPPRVWDLRTDKVRSAAGSLALPSGLRYGDTVQFSPHEKYLVDISAGERNSICLWEVVKEHGLSLRAKAVYDGGAAAISEDDRILATVSDDELIRFWDITSGRLLGSLVPFDNENWLVIAPDGRFDGKPSAWGNIFWRFPGNLLDTAPVEIFFSEFYYPGLLAEILSVKEVPTQLSISQKDRRQPQVKLVSANSQEDLNASATARIVKLTLNVTEVAADGDNKTGSGAQDVRLFRNGSLVRVWRGDVLKGQSTVTLKATVPIVAGENKFTAYAFNHDNIKSNDAEVIVTGASSLQRKGTIHILAVGVGNYANPQYDLNYTTDDATSVAAQLKLAQEKLGQYQTVEIKMLLNENATKANILLELRKLAGTVQPEDATVVYFSGHGKASGDHFYLVPYDLGYSGPRDQLSAEGLKEILDHSISDLELEEAFSGIDARQIFMIIDACNSGQALENKDEPRRGPMNTRGLAQLAYEKGMYIMTASQNVEEAFVSEKLKHSYLTYALVEEGLKTKVADTNHDGEVTLREWFDYASNRVPKLRDETLQRKSLEEVFPDMKAVRSRKSQTPRVFYRREAEMQPLIVAKP